MTARSLHQLVLAKVGEWVGPAAAAITAVLEVHRPYRIYDDCGHQPHDYAEDGQVPAGFVELEGIGLVCEAGYLYSICRECCADVVDPDVFQRQVCCDHHDHHDPELACWPCPTVRAVAEALEVQR